jgi:hypothetical protein
MIPVHIVLADTLKAGKHQGYNEKCYVAISKMHGYRMLKKRLADVISKLLEKEV